MDEIGDAGIAGGAGHGAGAEGMHGVEALAAALGEDRDEVDHRIRAPQGSGDGSRIAHIGLDRMDLANLADGLQVEGEVGAAGGDPNAPALAGERAHDVAPEEA